MSHFRFLVCSRFNYRQFVIPLIFGKKGGLNYLNCEIDVFDLRNVTVSSIFSLIFIYGKLFCVHCSNKNDSMPEANQMLQTNLTQIGNKMAWWHDKNLLSTHIALNSEKIRPKQKLSLRRCISQIVINYQMPLVNSTTNFLNASCRKNIWQVSAIRLSRGLFHLRSLRSQSTRIKDCFVFWKTCHLRRY